MLNHVHPNRNGLKAAVIVNDLSEVNIDAELVREGGGLSRTNETLVEMSNGCIRCTLREDLLREVERLAREDRFDYILIESTGVGEPVPVAQTFSYVDEELGRAGERAGRLPVDRCGDGVRLEPVRRSVPEGRGEKSPNPPFDMN